MKTIRRCIACSRPAYDHTPSRLTALGFRWHRYDPGERRAGPERRARRVVWTPERRKKLGVGTTREAVERIEAAR